MCAPAKFLILQDLISFTEFENAKLYISLISFNIDVIQAYIPKFIQ